MLKFLSLMIISTSAYAAGTGGISDLIAPAVNFAIFFGILYFALKVKIVDHFNGLADEVRSMMDSAAAKNKDAEAKLAEYESKMKNIDSETSKIKNEYDVDFQKFEKALKDETKTTIARMHRDVENKLASEKSVLVEELNKELVDSVIAKTKSVLDSNAETKKQATNKLISEVR